MIGTSWCLQQADSGTFLGDLCWLCQGGSLLMLLLNAISSNSCDFLSVTLINLRREVSKEPLLRQVTGSFCHHTPQCVIRIVRWEVNGMVNWKFEKQRDKLELGFQTGDHKHDGPEGASDGEVEGVAHTFVEKRECCFVSLFHKRDKLNSTVLYHIVFGIDVEICAWCLKWQKRWV